MHFNSQNALNASKSAVGSFKNACDGIFDDVRLLKVARRAHRFIERNRSEVTLRCSCIDYASLIAAENGPGHHTIEVCRGPSLKMDVEMCRVTAHISTADDADARNFVLKCRNCWHCAD